MGFPLTIAAILPHTKLYGGVKRFLELGNVFVEEGHDFYIFTPLGDFPTWFNFKGHVLPLSEIKNFISLDALFFTEPIFLDWVVESSAKHKIFYFVRESENLNKIKRYSNIEFYTNSTNLLEVARKKYKIEAFPAIGGINSKIFFPKKNLSKKDGEPFVIMAYGRLAEKRKGTAYVVKACERLQKKGYNIRLLLFDTPINSKMERTISKFKTSLPYDFVINHPYEKNVELFHKADLFVAPEKKAGWSNTSVEAMACGIPVIAAESGTKDFLFNRQTGLVVSRNSKSIAKAMIYLMENESERVAYAKNAYLKVMEFSWESLAKKIIDYLNHNS